MLDNTTLESIMADNNNTGHSHIHLPSGVALQ
jgi:hypothetical protein